MSRLQVWLALVIVFAAGIAYGLGIYRLGRLHSEQHIDLTQIREVCGEGLDSALKRAGIAALTSSGIYKAMDLSGTFCPILLDTGRTQQ